jgi:hypothetical protein
MHHTVHVLAYSASSFGDVWLSHALTLTAPKVHAGSPAVQETTVVSARASQIASSDISSHVKVQVSAEASGSAFSLANWESSHGVINKEST